MLNWLKNFFSSIPFSERRCSNCAHASIEALDERLEEEHPILTRYINSTAWHPKGASHASPLAWCSKCGYAVAIDGPSCEDWKRGRNV